MDANGQRAWLLAAREGWEPSPTVEWDAGCGTLRLASRRNRPPRALPADDHARATLAAEARERLERVPEARDAQGSWARYEPALGRVVAGGAGEGVVPLFKLRAPDVHASDLAVGADGVLHVAADGAVLLHDRRGRMEEGRVYAPGFAPWRLAAAPDGGCWVLDRAGRHLARTAGRLWPRRPWEAHDGDVFRPVPENPDPPALRVLEGVSWPEEETAGIACSPGGRVAVLAWRAEDGAGVLRFLEGEEALSPPFPLEGALYPYSLAWLSETRVAVLVPGAREALAYPVPAPGADAAELPQVGDLYPLRDFAEGPFLHTVALPPHYPTLAGSRPLHPLSRPGFAARGEAARALPVDAGATGAVWHRVFLEAAIPARCSVVLHLAATDTPVPPEEGAEWHPHRFGGAAAHDGVPVGVWTPGRSEVPFHPGILRGEPVPGERGIFAVLAQRAGRRVRALRGRWLWVRAELRGDGVATAEIAAVRVHGPRFSYRDRYLPELYRETVFGAEADAPAAQATAADFLDRFVANAEGVLTGIEDRIAAAHLLTDPASVPAESLGWLASWLGFAFDPALPPERRRATLAAAPELARRRGTARGLALALELATGGAVSRGEIVVLEDFRLRRTFATILGARLDEADDPLTLGLAASGNSYVGDTLFLGDEQRREFLALYGAQALRSAEEAEAVRAFLERLTHRLTLLVHPEMDAELLGLVRRIAEREVPAHVEWRMLAASGPLLVGVASLVGVDSYLGERPGRTPVVVDRTRLGTRDFVGAAGGLDLRRGGGTAPEAPVARFAEIAGAVPGDRPVLLDGSPSTAPPGRTLEGYQWTRRDPDR
jgi:phage tail-like protein